MQVVPEQVTPIGLRHSGGALQVTVCVGVHAPLTHRSPEVQLLPSLHDW